MSTWDPKDMEWPEPKTFGDHVFYWCVCLPVVVLACIVLGLIFALEAGATKANDALDRFN